MKVGYGVFGGRWSSLNGEMLMAGSSSADRWGRGIGFGCVV